MPHSFRVFLSGREACGRSLRSRVSAEVSSLSSLVLQDPSLWPNTPILWVDPHFSLIQSETPSKKWHAQKCVCCVILGHVTLTVLTVITALCQHDTQVYCF